MTCYASSGTLNLAQLNSEVDDGIMNGAVIRQSLTFSCVDVFSCRHAAIAKYFGDPLPLCNNSCDYCQNPAAVKKQSADAKIGTAPSSSRKRHRVSRQLLYTVRDKIKIRN